MLRFRARRYDTLAPVEITVGQGLIDSIQPLDPVHAPGDLPLVALSLFDLQINGYGGHWFSDAALTTAQVVLIADRLAQFGIGPFLPTIVTNTSDVMHRSLRAVVQAAVEVPQLQQRMIGIHLEGPWISPRDGPRGAHPAHAVRLPDLEEFDSLQRAARGLIRLVTLAPELPGIIRFIRELVARGVVVAIGHTAANADEIHAAIDAGATLGTHLGNGLEARIHRHHNPLWPQLADDRLTCSLIADGQHLPPDFFKTVLRAKPADRVLLTCDLSGWAGLPPGEHQSAWGACEVLESGKLVVAGQREFLAGSHLGLGDCVATAAMLGGISLTQAIDLATIQPRRLLNLPSPSLTPGAPADLILFREPQPAPHGLNASLPIHLTLHHGEVLHQAEDFAWPL